MPSEKSAWDTISNYEAHDIVRSRYQTKHDWEPNAALAREIAAPFIQARHYYSSAANADRTVKPLLLYYGVISLSRGLVLFLTPRLRDASLAQSHGLSVLNWQSTLSADRPDLAGLQITINSTGSFAEILTATGNRSLLRAGSSAVNHKISQGPIQVGAKITFGELLASLPDLIDQFKRWKTPQCVPFSVEHIDNSPESKITIPRWHGSYIDDRLAVNIFGSENCDVISVDEAKVVLQSKSGGEVTGIVTDFVSDRFLGIGNIYLAKPYTSGVRLAKISQLFAISYILSMFVRYYPAFWMDLMYQRIGDAAVPTIYKVIDCIETLYPQIIVDFLEEQ